MVPAWVAPFVRGPPSSPAEVTNAPGAFASVSSQLPVALLPASSAPTMTVYVPVAGAVAAVCAAEAPELFARSAPVGDTRRIHGVKSTDIGEVAPVSVDFTPWIRLVSPTGALLANSSGASAAQTAATAPATGTQKIRRAACQYS